MKEDNTYTINMVENHIRTLNVIDDDVLNILKNVPRKLFVPDRYKSFAHVDMSIPIGFDQHMLMPSVEAKILQAMNIKKNEDVLLVGSGTGYLSTCLSKLANRVHSIDIIQDFIDGSIRKTKALESKNMVFEQANILNCLYLIKSYKVIIFTIALKNIDYILDNMDNNTRSFIFQSEDNYPIQKGMVVYKTNKLSYMKEFTLETNVETILTSNL